MLEGRVNFTSPVTLLLPSCNSIPKLGLLPWSGGTVRVFMAYTVVHNVSANNTKYSKYSYSVFRRLPDISVVSNTIK